MRLLIGIVLALFAAVLIALWIREDPGYVMFSMGQLTIETSAVVFKIVLLICFVALYLIVRLVGYLFRSPTKLKAANKQRLLHKSERLLAKGSQELAEGNWKKAEITFSKGVENSPTPALHYIGAAQAAQKLGAQQRRDGYLRRAEDVPERDALAVKLSQAELLLEDGQPEKAKAILTPLRPQHPRQPRLLELLAQSHRELGEWHELQGLLPEMEKRKLLDKPQDVEMQVQTYRELLASAANLDELHKLWQQIPAALHHDESLLIDYAGRLRDHDAPSEAEALLRAALTHQWNEKLAVGYGEIGRGNATAQLAVAEEWLKDHEKDPYLLLTLGRLAKRGRQMDKARNYLEQSIRALPTPDAYQELGEVLEEVGDKDNASQCWRTGLRLLSGRPEEKEGIPVEEAQAVLPATQGASPAVESAVETSLEKKPQTAAS